MTQFEDTLHGDLHHYLVSLHELDEHFPDCPDVEEKWDEIARAYMPDGIREFSDYPTVSLGWMI